MSRILVTGAGGNVGRALIRELQKRDMPYIAGVTGIRPEETELGPRVHFDFADRTTWQSALADVDQVFLLRPPAIADVRTYLFPFIDLALEHGIRQIVFLSLQGVQFNPLTPHHKVEKYLRQRHAPYTFLRPNFFMQNLTTFYRDDIRLRNEIYLPAGRGRTALVDVRDIGLAAAIALSDSRHVGRAYTLSGSEALDYYQVAAILSETLVRTVTYSNPNVKDYLARLRAAGSPEDFVRVQKMLYFVVRHNLSAGTSSDLASLVNRAPTSFGQFAHDHAQLWQN